MTLEMAEAQVPLGGAAHEGSLAVGLTRVASWVLPVAAGTAGFPCDLCRKAMVNIAVSNKLKLK